MGKEQSTTRGDPPDIVGVQMSEEDGADIGRRDTGCGQRAGQQPSCGNRLRRIREPGRGGNIAGERDAGRPEARIHQDGQVLCLNQEAPHGDVVCPIGLQQFRVGAEVEAPGSTWAAGEPRRRSER